MSVSRSVVGGFGFVATDEEVETYLESIGKPIINAPYDDLFQFVHANHPELTVKLVGNQWQGDMAVLVCVKGTTVDNSDVRDDAPGLGLYEYRVLNNDEALVSILKLRTDMLGSIAGFGRFLGYQHGILVL